MSAPLTDRSPANYYCARAIATSNTFLFFNFEVLSPADPKQGLLQQPYRQMTAWTLSMPLPAQWAALDMPKDVFLIPFQSDLLVGMVIEQSRKGFNTAFKFRLEREEAEGQIG